jgi:transaldolase
MTNPLLELKALGQSAWLDDIDRGQQRSGLFQRLIDQDGITGKSLTPFL